MHGMISRSIQCFLQDTYGHSAWADVAAAVGRDGDGFEAMLQYDPAETEALLCAAVQRLARPRETILEDLGTYLVAHPHMQMIRRLLRFGGAGFVEFLYSLDELPERVRLAVPDLGLPALDLCEHGASRFTLRVAHPHPGVGHVAVGVLRAMADDYGALVLLEHLGRRDRVETVAVELADTAFSAGRAFDLRMRAG
ncbi:heme NO-binding domain-containing protein [Psychromarinibacter sp. C21-152]|uniref:Heme NO-binding domain-containing protein n=1 Tax=Psychromarinibacter sediminicola TaxID=3033385 RepID=A0AAE3T9Z2_9RHOB|nr:heme NO-binding domain-containing protein [Psychromarinibacter sediminicola]MDF0602737.1 heme NO-binding domain-containing protein [Psychromarinibacter sediminicola]